MSHKKDLPEWSVTPEQFKSLEQRGWRIFETSAKQGTEVEELFTQLCSYF